MKCTSADIICICQVILNTHWYLILNFIYIYQHIKALFFQILFDFIYFLFIYMYLLLGDYLYRYYIGLYYANSLRFRFRRP